MEQRHEEALRRIYEADRMLEHEAREPEEFLLIYTGGGSEILHPGWDPSWAVPSGQTIHDLGELGILRVQAPVDKRRRFALTMRGRVEGRALTERYAMPTPVGGSAPPVDKVLAWLLKLQSAAPELFHDPDALVDRGVTDGLINVVGKEALAQRILDLVSEHFVKADILAVEEASARQRLSWAGEISLTMKALGHKSSSGPIEINFYGPVVNSQIAAGDIKNYQTFMDVLVRAESEIEALADIDDETRSSAGRLLRRLSGKSADTAAQVITEAAGSLVATVLARLLGISPA